MAYSRGSLDPHNRGKPDFSRSADFPAAIGKIALCRDVKRLLGV